MFIFRIILRPEWLLHSRVFDAKNAKMIHFNYMRKNKRFVALPRSRANQFKLQEYRAQKLLNRILLDYPLRSGLSVTFVYIAPFFTIQTFNT